MINYEKVIAEEINKKSNKLQKKIFKLIDDSELPMGVVFPVVSIVKQKVLNSMMELSKEEVPTMTFTFEARDPREDSEENNGESHGQEQH